MKNALRLVGLLVALPLFAGDVSGGGGGLGEQNFTFAYRNLGRFLEVCLKTPVCQLTKEDREVVEFIAAELPNEYAANPSLHFTASQTRFTDGQLAPRIAVTGYYVGAPIHINLALLYEKQTDGTTRPLSIAEAVSVLVHELGHHKGRALTHDYLDGVGMKVRGGYLTNAQRTKFPRIFMSKYHMADFAIEAVNTATHPDWTMFKRQNSTLVVLTDGENLFDLSSEVAKLPCPDGPGVLDSVLLDNFHWLRSVTESPVSEGHFVTLKAYSAAKVTCLGGSRNRVHTWDYDLVVPLTFKTEVHPTIRTPWRFVPGSAKPYFIRCGGTRSPNPNCH
jgi:hypothetical protein